MGNVPSKVGVFFGSADKGSAGWYWTDASIRRMRKTVYMGPFETKESAVKNAVRCLAAQQSPNDKSARSRLSSVSSSEVTTQRALPLTLRRSTRLLHFWTRVRAECNALVAMRSGPRWVATARERSGL